MIPEYNNPWARNITPVELSIDEQIRVEQEQLFLAESRPDYTSKGVSEVAKMESQARHWLNMQRTRIFRVRDQDELVKFRIGNQMHHREFIRKLNTLPGRRFSYNSWGVRGYRGMNVSRGGGRPEYVCAVQDGVCPEWDQISLDAHELVKRVTFRGWRTVLINLINKRIVTEQEIRKLFGWANGQHGKLFRKYLYEMRNHRLADGEAQRERDRLTKKESF